MRKISLVLLSIGAVLALSLYWHGSATAQDPQIEEPNGPVYPGGDTTTGWGDWWFGQRIAGTWLNTFEVPGAEPGTTITTQNADGTAVTAAGNAFLGLGDPGIALQSTFHQTWKRTGCRQLTFGHLVYGYRPTDGTLLFIVRATGQAEYDSDFEESNGVLTVEFFWPEQLLDPLDPNTEEEPFLSVDATFTGRRLHVP
jgi:hypothetical protein